MSSAAVPAPVPVVAASASLLVDNVGDMDNKTVGTLSSFCMDVDIDESFFYVDIDESCFDVDIDESRNRSHKALPLTDHGSSSFEVFDFDRVMGEAGLDFGDWIEAEVDAIVQAPPPAAPQAATVAAATVA